MSILWRSNYRCKFVSLSEDVMAAASRVSRRDGWVCLSAALDLILLPFPFLFFFVLLLLLVTFAMSIIVMSNGDAKGGMGLLVCTIILPPVFWYIGLRMLYSFG